jgi:hypothetical protein
MLTYFINRAGEGLSAARRTEARKGKGSSFKSDPREQSHCEERKQEPMIRKLKSGEYRLYSRKRNSQTGKRRNLGTFRTRQEAEQHEREVQFFKRR